MGARCASVRRASAARRRRPAAAAPGIRFQADLKVRLIRSRGLMNRKFTAAVLVAIFAIAPTQLVAQAPAAQEPLSALAPENLAKPRPKAPFDLTGNWFVDTSNGPDSWRFGPPYPKLTAKAQAEFDTGQKYLKEGKVYKDDIGQCWPAGLPLIMTRYWPMAMIQLPTAVYMVSGFMNSFRTVFLDGRKHTDPDIVVRTHNGES